MISRGWYFAPQASIRSSTLFFTQLDSWLLVEIHSLEGKENQVIQVNEMKVQVPDFTENLTQLERDLFHFLTSSKGEKDARIER